MRSKWATAKPRDEGTAGKLTAKTRFTKKQGRYLAYIHLYRKLHRQGPAESDIARDFRVSPPTVHQMIVRLEELGLITREPGVPRSVRVTLPANEIPDLEDEED